MIIGKVVPLGCILCGRTESCLLLLPDSQQTQLVPSRLHWPILCDFPSLCLYLIPACVIPLPCFPFKMLNYPCTNGSRVQNLLSCQSSLLSLLQAMSSCITFDAQLDASHIALRKLQGSCCLKLWFYLEFLLQRVGMTNSFTCERAISVPLPHWLLYMTVHAYNLMEH